MADTSELLLLCEQVVADCSKGYAGCPADIIARALKSRLQAEAPEDADELDEISLATDIHEMVLCMAPETPIEDQASNLAKHLLKYWRMTWRGDTARTQAEAQAPAVLTDEEREHVKMCRQFAGIYISPLVAIIDRITRGNV